jgi:hypothetical protein
VRSVPRLVAYAAAAGVWLSWLERHHDTVEVRGSIPRTPTLKALVDGISNSSARAFVKSGVSVWRGRAASSRWTWIVLVRVRPLVYARTSVLGVVVN